MPIKQSFTWSETCSTKGGNSAQMHMCTCILRRTKWGTQGVEMRAMPLVIPTKRLNVHKAKMCSFQCLPLKMHVLSFVSLYWRKHWKKRHKYGRANTQGIHTEWLPQVESGSNHDSVATYQFQTTIECQISSGFQEPNLFLHIQIILAWPIVTWPWNILQVARSRSERTCKRKPYYAWNVISFHARWQG